MTGVSSTGPDTRRFRAFYDQPAPVEFDVELPDDIDGPADLADFVKDAAPFAKLTAVRVEPVGTVAGSAVSGLSDGHADMCASESGQDDSGHLRARRHLAALIAGTPGVWSTPTRTDAEAIAAAVLAAGYRLVADDDTTQGAEGCRCHACGIRYRVDFNVPDALWTRIGMPTPGGLLCGRCIADRIESLGEFGAYQLVDLARALTDTAAVRGDQP